MFVMATRTEFHHFNVISQTVTEKNLDKNCLDLQYLKEFHVVNCLNYNNGERALQVWINTGEKSLEQFHQ